MNVDFGKEKPNGFQSLPKPVMNQHTQIPKWIPSVFGSWLRWFSGILNSYWIDPLKLKIRMLITCWLLAGFSTAHAPSSGFVLDRWNGITWCYATVAAFSNKNGREKVPKNSRGIWYIWYHLYCRGHRIWIWFHWCFFLFWDRMFFLERHLAVQVSTPSIFSGFSWVGSKGFFVDNFCYIPEN